MLRTAIFSKYATSNIWIARRLTSIQELASALQSAQPKIQKMCEEESDDQEAVAKLFEINDSIHRTIERYKLIKKGDLDGASKIPKGTLGTSTGVTKTADNELSLIDFGGDPEPSSNAVENVDGPREQKPASIEDDLLGLSMSDQSYGQSGGIALGFGANSSKLQSFQTPAIAILMHVSRCTRAVTTLFVYPRKLRKDINIESFCPNTTSFRTAET